MKANGKLEFEYKEAPDNILMNYYAQVVLHVGPKLSIQHLGLPPRVYDLCIEMEL